MRSDAAGRVLEARSAFQLRPPSRADARFGLRDSRSYPHCYPLPHTCRTDSEPRVLYIRTHYHSINHMNYIAYLYVFYLNILFALNSSVQFRSPSIPSATNSHGHRGTQHGFEEQTTPRSLSRPSARSSSMSASMQCWERTADNIARRRTAR